MKKVSIYVVCICFLLGYTACTEDVHQEIIQEESAMFKGGAGGNVQVVELNQPPAHANIDIKSVENVKVSREVAGEGSDREQHVLGRYNAEYKIFGCMNDGDLYRFYEENDNTIDLVSKWLEDEEITVEYLEVEDANHIGFCPCGELLHTVRVRVEDQYLEKLIALGFEEI